MADAVADFEGASFMLTIALNLGGRGDSAVSSDRLSSSIEMDESLERFPIAV